MMNIQHKSTNIPTKTPRGPKYLLGLWTLLILFVLGACSNMLTLNPNREPVVIVTPSAFTNIYPGNSVTFDGTGSFDPDDQDLKVLWEVINSPTGATYFLDNPTTFTPTFTTFYRNSLGSDLSDRWVVGPEDYSVPSYLGNYTLRMTVTDTYGVQRSSDVTVNVANAAPGANTGPNSIGVVAPDDDLLIQGSGGSNEESSRRNTWQYRWSVTDQPRDSTFNLTNTDWTDPSDPSISNTATVTFTPLIVGSINGNPVVTPGRGVYTLRLEVRDEYGATSTNSIVVATTGNTAPELSMPSNVTISSGTLGGDGTTGTPYRSTTATLPDYAINLDFLPVDVTNEEDDTMTVTWRVHSLRPGVEQLRFRVDGGADLLYQAGNILKTQGIVRGDEPDFEIDIAPSSDLTDVFRYTAAGSSPSATADPDGVWDLAIQVVANDGAVADSTPPIIYISLYTPTP